MKNNLRPGGRGSHRDPVKEQFWRDALKRFAASGQSVREFCAARQLTETAFYFWRNEIRRRDGQMGIRQKQPLTFARVLVQEPEPTIAEPGLRLRLDNGRELLLPASWPVAQLAALVRAIEATV